MTPAERYLRLSTAYCDFIGGLRWSSDDNALEYKHGPLFAFTEEVALFLEGFAGVTGGKMVHFAFVLHLIQLVLSKSRLPAPRSRRLSQAFADAGGPTRNAGAFCAVLCRDIPEVAGPLDPREVLERLRDTARPMRWFVAQFHDTFFLSELPPLGPSAFEEEILRNLEAYSDEELREWLRHGRGPVKEAAVALAHAVPPSPPPPPRTLSGALAALLERPRLAGARPFVTQLLSALALPPRQRATPELPQGGYSDVATNGQPHQLLPSQFALDELDFLRRFADRELLFFRREEPHVRTRHELVVLLDQGVRTWGDVRIVLAAAVLALGRLAERGKLSFLVAAGSAEGFTVDPATVDAEVLGRLVEASDLSANPGLALERVLDKPADGTRDIVLLTHPRSLAEEEVRAAALRATPETRVMALSLDGRGRAAVSELRHGVPVPIRQFRVDFSQVEVPAAPTAARFGPWRGDVEPVGFPFRFGTDQTVGPKLFDFDFDGLWLLTATKTGVLHAWSVRGQKMHMLPRALVRGRVLRDIEAVVGVAGGFVVIGRDQKNFVAAHYDLYKQTCAVHDLGEAPPQVDWCYSAAHHSLLEEGVHVASRHALDLTNGSRYPSPRDGDAGRARDAWQAAARGLVPCRRLGPGNDADGRPACSFDPARGEIRVFNLRWCSFTPLANGRPALKGQHLREAQCRGSVLAAVTSNPGLTLRLFRGPEGVPIVEFPVEHGDHGFTLSSDGQLLARQISGHRVEILEVGGTGTPLATTITGRFSAAAVLLLHEQWLLVRAGERFDHELDWRDNVLKTCVHNRHNPLSAFPAFSGEQSGRTVPFVPSTTQGVPEWLGYDPQRFISGATGTVTAVLDQFGQITLFDANRELVCMFFVFRNQLSGWLPDGTCFGPASASGQLRTPEILEKMGLALARASALGRAKACK